MIVCAVFYGDTDGEGSVAVDFRSIKKGLIEELEEGLRKRRDCFFYPNKYFSERSNRRRMIAEQALLPLEKLLALRNPRGKRFNVPRISG